MKARHWRPLEPVSWPSGRNMRTFHTGYAVVCSARNAWLMDRELVNVTCKSCLRLASRARFDNTGEPTPCVVHSDCRQSIKLGTECKRTALPISDERSGK